MYCLELIKFDDSSNTYYVEVENGALFARRCAVMGNDPRRSWKVMEIFLGKRVGTLR